MSIFTSGPTALIVSSAIDPDVTLDAFARRGFRPALWVAKLTGTDTGGAAEIKHCFDRVRARGLYVGGWIQCGWSPQRDVASIIPWLPQLDLVEFCIEVEYKANDASGDKYRADGLLAAAQETLPPGLPRAIISYGRRDLAMRTDVFKAAGGWHVVPECYDAFSIADADSYYPSWAGNEIHPLVRTFDLIKYRGNRAGIYRPEGLL